MTTKTAIVAGGSGIIGRRIVEHLAGTGDWSVIALSRRPRNMKNVRWIAVDLNDPEDCQRKLGALHEVTHIFYAARHDFRDGELESADINGAMFRNVVTTLEPVAKLRHVHAVHGAKYYGQHVSKLPGPMIEDMTPRWNIRNFYYEQEDFLRAHSPGKTWTYTTSRPHMLCDAAFDYARSTGLVIFVYALIQRELGLTLDFPGTASGFHMQHPMTETRLLARCIAWMAQEPRCASQAFNVVNGDKPSWASLWPGFAAWFGIQAGPPRDFKLVDYLADKGPVWDRLVQKHGLPPSKLETIALWPYGDRQFRSPWDSEMSMAKARTFGFDETLDSGAMYAQHFTEYLAAGKA